MNTQTVIASVEKQVVLNDELAVGSNHPDNSSKNEAFRFKGKLKHGSLTLLYGHSSRCLTLIRDFNNENFAGDVSGIGSGSLTLSFEEAGDETIVYVTDASLAFGEAETFLAVGSITLQ